MFRRRLAAALLLFSSLSVPALAGGLEDGRRLLGDKRYVSAATAYRKVLKVSAGSREAMLGLAKAVSEGRLGSEAYQEVEALLRERLRAQADDRPVRLALGEVFLAWVAEDDRYRADAQDQFQKLAQTDPSDPEAAVGLARVYWIAGDTGQALGILDEFLVRKPDAAVAHHGKGVILYADATGTYNASKDFAAAKPLFERAVASFEAAAKADATRRDTWLQLAYASQWISGGDPARETATAEAYEKALLLDLDDPAPLRGLAALLKSKPEVYAATLARLAKDHPKAPAVLLAQADGLKAAGKLDEAEAAYRAYIAAAKAPALGWAHLGGLLEQKGDAAGWKKAYEKSIELDPDSWIAGSLGTKLLVALDARLESSWDDVGKAKKLLDEYRALAALLPTNKAVRNDGGFFCREAYAKTGKREAALLKGSVELYEAASALIPEYNDAFEQTVPYPERHANAQILNDTGLMFQYEPANLDLKKAEAYYRRAMEWTQYGYWDAFGNLNKILQTEGRWQEAYDFAAACAEGIKKEDGTPNESFRATCAGVRDKLEAKLPKDK